MKTVFVVSQNSYRKHPFVVCSTMEDAKKFASTLSDSSEENLDDMVLELPYVGEVESYDIADIIIASVESAKKSFEAGFNTSINYNNEQTEDIENHGENTL